MRMLQRASLLNAHGGIIQDRHHPEQADTLDIGGSGIASPPSLASQRACTG